MSRRKAATRPPNKKKAVPDEVTAHIDAMLEEIERDP